MYDDLRPRGVSFDCCSNSALASELDSFCWNLFTQWTRSGSGRVGEVDDVTGVKLKYFRILVLPAAMFE